MIYVAMVGDMSTLAYNRMNDDYNFPGYPTIEIDGGWRNIVGGYSDESMYTDLMDDCAVRPVFEGLNMIVAIDWVAANTVRTRIRVANGIPANTKPAEPDAPVAPEVGLPNVAVEIEMATSDPDADQIYYQVDWGEGSKVPDDWEGPFPSSETTILSHTYQTEAAYDIIVRVKDEWDATTGWSPPATVMIGCCESIGDINNDGVGPNIEDLVFLVLYMFQDGDVPECLDHANINGDEEEQPNIEDLVYLVMYMFQDGPALPTCPY